MVTEQRAPVAEGHPFERVEDMPRDHVSQPIVHGRNRLARSKRNAFRTFSWMTLLV
jgi:hypothetical protein